MTFLPPLPVSRACRRTPTASRYLILVLGVLVSGCMSPGASSAAVPVSPAAGFTFEEHEIVTGIANHQTVLSGFLLGGTTADLAVVSFEKNGDRAYASTRQRTAHGPRHSIRR